MTERREDSKNYESILAKVKSKNIIRIWSDHKNYIFSMNHNHKVLSNIGQCEKKLWKSDNNDNGKTEA